MYITDSDYVTQVYNYIIIIEESLELSVTRYMCDNVLLLLEQKIFHQVNNNYLFVIFIK